MMPLTTEAALSAIGEKAEEKACEESMHTIAASAHQTTTKPKLAEYHHQLLFAPPTSTVLKAIKNNQLESFPGLDQTLLKFLPPSTATHKGHMHMKRKNVRSTRKKEKEKEDPRLDEDDMNPAQEACTAGEYNVFCYAALADTNTGVIYTDLPGEFPVCSV